MVFKVDNAARGFIPTGEDGNRFDHKVLEAVMKDIIKTVCQDDNATLADTSDNQFPTCPTFVVANKVSNVDGPPTLFRSYSCREEDADKCAIWQAARATTAALSFFQPVHIETPSPGGLFIDGGLMYNNPVELVIKEATKIWTDIDYFCVVSVGTGRQRSVVGAARTEENVTNSQVKGFLGRVPGIKSLVRVPAGIRAVTTVADACVRLATSSESAHQSILRRSQPRNSWQGFAYHRFNVERDMGSIDLQEWQKLEEIAECAARYMDEEEGREKRNKCAQDLIRPPHSGCKSAFS